MLDRTGQTFGMLTVIAFDHVAANRHSYWRCRCECGTEILARHDNLVGNSILSCGCLRSGPEDRHRSVSMRPSIYERIKHWATATGKSMGAYLDATIPPLPPEPSGEAA